MKNHFYLFLFLFPFCANAQPGIKLVAATAAMYQDGLESQPVAAVTPPARQGGRLRLSFSDGSGVSFTDNKGLPYDEDRKSYTYVGLLSALNKYVVKLKTYESTCYLLVDKNNGKIDSLIGMPKLSPDKKSIVAAYYNQEETYGDMQPPTQDLVVYSITPDNRITATAKTHFKLDLADLRWHHGHTPIIVYKADQSSKSLKYGLLNFGQMSNKSLVTSQAAGNTPSAKWNGSYVVFVEGEMTTTGMSSITYDFSVTGVSAVLETTTTHEPVQCNGAYRAVEQAGHLLLFYNGNEATCKSNAAAFQLKAEAGKYFIKGVGGEGELKRWITIEKSK